MKDYNFMIDGQNAFGQPVKDDVTTYDNIRKIWTRQGGDYTTDYLLDHNYFKEYCPMIAIDLSKQQALDADPKARQQINFTGNLARERNAHNVFHYSRSKRNKIRFLKWSGKNFVSWFSFNIIIIQNDST